MVSYAPNTQSLNYTHMWNFQDLRGKAPEISPNPGSIYEFITCNKGFSKIKKIVENADLGGFLNDIQANFTFIIPKDHSIKDYPEEFFTRMDKGYAKEIINSALINRKIDYNLITSSPVSYLYTRNPKMRMYVTNINERTRINDCVNVLEYNINLANGLIHIVDGLILPSENTFMN